MSSGHNRGLGVDIHCAVRKLKPGSLLQLGKECIVDPVVISGISGSKDKPVVIRGLPPEAPDRTSAKRSPTIFGTATSFDKFSKRANDLARVHEAGGSFPGLYFMADNAQLILRDCQWIVLEDLTFENCWPTAIYIENCQHITIRGVHIRGGTFAIGATGIDTRHLLIENCDWIQDTTCHGDAQIRSIRDKGLLKDIQDVETCHLWRQTDWDRIHGEYGGTKKHVSPDDARAYDGDFFRAWTIAGYVILRNNCIMDAFNGIHFFNQLPKEAQDRYSRNVLICDNWFVRIRDNAVEPEDYAVNWTVRHNKFIDCYAAFSIEPDRSGYFYIYGNLGWSRERPGPDDKEPSTGRIFKFGSAHEDVGPHYVIHNSWYVRNPIFKKKRISNFHHMNNAVAYNENADSFDYERVNPFGRKWEDPHDSTYDWPTVKSREKMRFTKAWSTLGITIDNDMIGHPLFPSTLRAAGYPLGDRSSGKVPNFADASAHGSPKGMKLENAEPAARLKIRLPDSTELENYTCDEAPLAVGAWQGNALFTLPDPLFAQYWEHPDMNGVAETGDGKKCC